jgi:hypothetical protein
MLQGNSFVESYCKMRHKKKNPGDQPGIFPFPRMLGGIRVKAHSFGLLLSFC